MSIKSNYEYLYKEEIILINKMTIQRHGGNFMPPKNFLHESPLDYLVEIIEAEMYGEALYPSIHEKAGLYMYNIIANHVFSDGNKRTGLGAAMAFIKLNDFKLKKKLDAIFDEKTNISIPNKKCNSSMELLIEFTLAVAAGSVSLENCQKWFQANIIDAKPPVRAVII
ncbi:MAG: type II toxin-antitoxin system death-on-curing family toxin [Chitinophagales bacterium]